MKSPASIAYSRVHVLCYGAGVSHGNLFWYRASVCQEIDTKPVRSWAQEQNTKTWCGFAVEATISETLRNVHEERPAQGRSR